MGPLFHRGKRAVWLLALAISTVCASYPQSNPTTCQVSAVPAQVRSEGVTERVGDVLLQCSGSNAGATISGNLALLLPVPVTNRIDSGGLASGATVSVDYGSGFVPTGIAGLVTNQRIAFNGVTVTVPPSGNFNLRISNVRIDASGVASLAPAPILAGISYVLPLSQGQAVVAYSRPGLLTNITDRTITCAGSPLPSTLDMASLFAAGTSFSSTRLTEGAAGVFQPPSAGDDNGTRFLISYFGFPANASLYLPDYVAGSGAVAPTAGGDLSLPQNAGKYLPGSGTLLLVRVLDADSSGARGTPAPLPTGPTAVTLGSVSAVPLANGAGFAVYEVADANPAARETVQFPTFIGLPGVTAASSAQETISFAPVTTELAASETAPVPRFVAVAPGSDCTVMGDCGSALPPALSVPFNSMVLTALDGAMVGGPTTLPVRNGGGGALAWTATVSYLGTPGWLVLDTTSGKDQGAIRVSANPRGLAPGQYYAYIMIDAGEAGSFTVSVFLNVQISKPAVTVSEVLNAATLEAAPAVAGSLTTLKGGNLSGKSVSVTFDGLPATLLYTSSTQINLQVPPELGSKNTATMVVTVDGVSSAPQTVALAPAWPAIFNPGVLNQDNAVNGPAAGAAPGSIVQIYGTGIPAGATVSVQIGDRKDLVPLYAGAAPTLTGVQQVNVTVPDGIAPGSTGLIVCATAAGRQYCSPAYSLTVR
jgi:uncharacterized protein (TIGR03437 family)